MVAPTAERGPPERIEILMPTKNSQGVVEETLERGSEAATYADLDIERLRVVDNSDDRTTDIIRETARSLGWSVDIIESDTSLPEARQRLIDRCETDWFWFLDDDVRVRQDYLQQLVASVSPVSGAVQGRKAKRADETATDWLQWRARRGGTHATLIRQDAVAGIDIPSDLHVLEDEFIRRYVDSGEYVWQFNHHAIFDHDNQDRHHVGWLEGYLGGKYGLRKGSFVLLEVPFAAVTGREVWPHAKSAAGWLWGRRHRTTDANRNGGSDCVDA